MKTLKEKAIKVKNHIKRNKVAYAMTTVAGLAIWLQQTNRIAFEKFLKEKGIDPSEYFYPEMFEEMNVLKTESS